MLQSSFNTYLKPNAIHECEINVPYHSGFESLSYADIQDYSSRRRIKILPEFEKWLDNYIEDFDTDFFNHEYNESEIGRAHV